MTGWHIPINAAIGGVLVLAVAFAVCLVGAWVCQEWALREDIEDQRPDGWTKARFAASAEMRDPVKLHDTVKSVKRHLRRHGKRGQR